MKGKQVKTILMITQGNRDHASSRIRAVQYFPLLGKAGFSYLWIPRVPQRPVTPFEKIFVFPFLKRLNYLRILFGITFCSYKLLFIQRIFLPAAILKIAVLRKKQLIYDFDDALYISEIDKNAADKTERMIRNAQLVIVSSTVLAEYASKYNDRVVMITSPVDMSLIKPALTKHPDIVIGWSGSEWTSNYLLPLSGVFHRLLMRYKVKYLFVGCKNGILPEINPEIVKWSPDSEYECLSRMDIGIMPLDDGDFEKGKGGYKLFLYMAAHLPVVASPVGINTGIIENGRNGFLCDTPDEWCKALEALVIDETKRRQYGESGYKDVLEKYSLEKCFEQLLNAFRSKIPHA